MGIWWHIMNVKLDTGTALAGPWSQAAVALALAICCMWYLFRAGGPASRVGRPVWQRQLMVATAAAVVALSLAPLVWPLGPGR